MPDSYYTLKQGVCIEAEFKDRKSTFIAHLTHVESEQEAQAFIESIKARHRDARHNVPAYVLHSGAERCSDDGEPQRTSGLPSLEVLKTSDLQDVCVVVTRYFGGVLLGPGGLKRAYTSACQLAVQEAQEQGLLVHMTELVPVDVVIPYAQYDQVLHKAQAHGAHVIATDFTDVVCLHLSFLAGKHEAFVQDLIEINQGVNPCKVGLVYFGEF